MNQYSDNSENQLKTCDVQLQHLFRAVLPYVNHTILVGHRNEEDQHKAFLTGKSKLDWPNGNHNKLPSSAVDAAPYPIDFSESHKNLARFYYFAGFVKAMAFHMGLKIRWGGDWDSDNDFKDQKFDDLVHFELVT